MRKSEGRRKQVEQKRRERLLPFTLTGGLIIIDQITKLIIVKTIELHTVGASFFEGFLRIVHTRNLGIAFSMGGGFSDTVRSVLFTVLPIVVLGLLMVYYFKQTGLTRLQRWSIAAVFAGGVGNLIDRIFRPLGVVDFIDVKFFGIFGLERWPTFNIADASVVVAGIILIFTVLFEEGEKKDEQKN